MTPICFKSSFLTRSETGTRSKWNADDKIIWKREGDEGNTLQSKTTRNKLQLNNLGGSLQQRERQSVEEASGKGPLSETGEEGLRLVACDSGRGGVQGPGPLF